MDLFSLNKALLILYSKGVVKMSCNYANSPFGLLKAFIMTLIPMPAMAAVAVSDAAGNCTQ